MTDAPERIWLGRDERYQGEPWIRLASGFDEEESKTQEYIRADLAAPDLAELVATYYIDCEFDGHDGPLLSIAMVRHDGYSLHVMVATEARDPWVIANVVPFMSAHRADKAYVANLNDVGGVLRDFIGDCQNPTIIADSPVDIGRFCRAISTGPGGGWASADYPGMTFIVRNVDCYPTTLQGAVQHNAWWDAMALRAALAKIKEPQHE